MNGKVEIDLAVYEELIKGQKVLEIIEETLRRKGHIYSEDVEILLGIDLGNEKDKELLSE